MKMGLLRFYQGPADEPSIEIEITGNAFQDFEQPILLDFGKLKSLNKRYSLAKNSPGELETCIIYFIYASFYSPERSLSLIHL